MIVRPGIFLLGLAAAAPAHSGKIAKDVGRLYRVRAAALKTPGSRLKMPAASSDVLYIAADRPVHRTMDLAVPGGVVVDSVTGRGYSDIVAALTSASTPTGPALSPTAALDRATGGVLAPVAPDSVWLRLGRHSAVWGSSAARGRSLAQLAEN